jgi:hypothetical protein
MTACEPYTENLFDKPAAERIAESLQTYHELLTAQTNGWLVEYYPEKTQKYGGFNLFFRFGNEYVTVGSEINPSETSASLWSMGSDMGPTINFDTYNTVLHYFSDPELNQGGGRGLNYEGDYEFYVESGSETEFILRGKKTKNIIRMTPLPAGSKWDEYGKSIQRMRDNVVAPDYKMTINGKEISIEKSINANLFILKTNSETVYAPFIVTLNGIKFYTPIEIEHQTLQFFTYQNKEDILKSDDGNSIISFVVSSLSNYFINNLALADWNFSTDNIGPGYLPAWNTAKTNLEKYDLQLIFMWLGILADGYPKGISFGVYEEEEDAVWWGTYAYNFEAVGDNRVKFVYNKSLTSSNGINADVFAPMMQDFTINAFNGRTFTLEPDVDVSDPKNMTNIKEFKLIDVTNPNNWVKVGLEDVIWP